MASRRRITIRLLLVLILFVLPASNAMTCSKPGRSSLGLRACPKDQVVTLRVKNRSRITIVVGFVTRKGTLAVRRPISPGFKFSFKTCTGHRWMMQTLCETCAAVKIIPAATGGTMFFAYRGGAAETSCPPHPGEWSEVFKWERDVIPVGLVNLPGGKMLGFASRNPDDFNGPAPNGDSYTFAAIWDPKTNELTTADLDGHNMFCPGMTMLQDGRLLVQGGGVGDDGYRVSIFDPSTNKWSREGDTASRHWYGTAIETGTSKSVVAALGVTISGTTIVDSFFPEKSSGYNFGATWKVLNGIDLDGPGPNVQNWYPNLHLMPNGELLMSGPQNDMYTFDISGSGKIKFAGKRNTENDEREPWGGCTLYFAKAKVITAGGIQGYSAIGSLKERSDRKHVIQIDFKDPSNIKPRRVADITHERSFLNLVGLPNGEVLAVGGTRCKREFCDAQSELRPERWNPITNKWTVGAPMDVPRNYHSTALLMKDGTVMSAGGGLCGPCGKLNHPDHQIYFPPYLFNQDGSRAKRPVIRSIPSTFGHGDSFKIRVSGARAFQIVRATMVRLASTTHSVSTDSRMLRVRINGKKKISSSVFEYTVTAEKNKNVLVAGRWFFFVINSYGVPSVGADVFVK